MGLQTTETAGRTNRRLDGALRRWETLCAGRKAGRGSETRIVLMTADAATLEISVIRLAAQIFDAPAPVTGSRMADRTDRTSRS